MQLQDIRILFDYIYWARSRVLDLVDTLSREQFTRDMRTSHHSIQGTLVHMFGSEQLWLSRWQGKSPTHRENPGDYPSASDIRVRWEQIEREVRSYLDSMDEADVLHNIAYTSLEGASVSYPWWNTAVQVTNHSSYHLWSNYHDAPSARVECNWDGHHYVF